MPSSISVWVRSPINREAGPKLQEEVLPRPEEIGPKGLERGRKELQPVLEHQVLASAQPKVLLHSLGIEVDVLPEGMSGVPKDQGRIEAAEVVDEDRHLVPLP